MANRFAFALLAAAILFIPGCAFPETYIIESIQNVLVVGVDSKDGQIRLTALVDRIEQGSEPGKEQVSTQVYVATGETVSDAKRNLNTFAERRTSWYHLKYIIVGEEIAKQNVGNALDFFCENDESRFLHRLLVAKGASAADLILQNTGDGMDFTGNLDSLIQQVKQTGEASEVHLLDYATSCECGWAELYIPVLEAAANVHYGATGEEGSSGDLPAARLGGYALLKNNRLTGFINGHQAMGLNFAINRISRAEIVVADINGNPVSLDVMQSSADIQTKIDGAPSASIRVTVSSFMGEYHNPSGATSEEYIRYLEVQQSAYIAELIASALEAAKGCGSDVFGIGSALYHAYPVKSAPYKENWCDIFPSVEVSIEVRSKIQCTYSMLDAPGK